MSFLSDLVPLLLFLHSANPGPCLAAERSRAINLSSDLRKQVEELERRLDSMTLEKESTLGRVRGVVDKLSRT